MAKYFVAALLLISSQLCFAAPAASPNFKDAASTIITGDTDPTLAQNTVTFSFPQTTDAATFSFSWDLSDQAADDTGYALYLYNQSGEALTIYNAAGTKINNGVGGYIDIFDNGSDDTVNTVTIKLGPSSNTNSGMGAIRAIFHPMADIADMTSIDFTDDTYISYYHYNIGKNILTLSEVTDESKIQINNGTYSFAHGLNEGGDMRVISFKANMLMGATGDVDIAFTTDQAGADFQYDILFTHPDDLVGPPAWAPLADLTCITLHDTDTYLYLSAANDANSTNGSVTATFSGADFDHSISLQLQEYDNNDFNISVTGGAAVWNSTVGYADLDMPYLGQIFETRIDSTSTMTEANLILKNNSVEHSKTPSSANASANSISFFNHIDQHFVAQASAHSAAVGAISTMVTAKTSDATTSSERTAPGLARFLIAESAWISAPLNFKLIDKTVKLAGDEVGFSFSLLTKTAVTVENALELITPDIQVAKATDTFSNEEWFSLRDIGVLNNVTADVDNSTYYTTDALTGEKTKYYLVTFRATIDFDAAFAMRTGEVNEDSNGMLFEILADNDADGYELKFRTYNSINGKGYRSAVGAVEINNNPPSLPDPNYPPNAQSAICQGPLLFTVLPSKDFIANTGDILALADQPFEAEVDLNSDTLVSYQNHTDLRIPQNAITGETSAVISIEKALSQPYDTSLLVDGEVTTLNIIEMRNIDLQDTDGVELSLDADKKVYVSIQYDQAEASAMEVDEENLKIYHYTAGAWVALSSGGVDIDSNRVWGYTDDFSPFVVAQAAPIVVDTDSSSPGGAPSANPGDGSSSISSSAGNTGSIGGGNSGGCILKLMQ